MDSYAKGFVAGAFGVFISHPFDTIKTLIQENKQIPKSIKQLYRGVTAPIIGVGFEKSVVFGTYHFAKLNLGIKNEILNTFTCGAISGLSASIVVTPFERVKILVQGGSSYKNALSDIRYMYRGLTGTFLRETPGFAIYFTVYEQLKKLFYGKGKIELFASFIFGAIAGTISWVPIYPQDRIKTRMQSKNIGFLKALEEIKSSGEMYRGFRYALMRAIPLHAGAFFMFETLTKFQNSVACKKMTNDLR
jgi:solute carrier family 25 carnitine/acylcarnitine transporter 20/29